MKKKKRDMHTIKSNKNRYYDDLAKKSPHKRAREWMHRPAYQSEKLSYQARLMIRKQGKQTKHLEADEYVRRRELK